MCRWHSTNDNRDGGDPMCMTMAPYEKGHIEKIKKKKVVRRLARRCFVGYCKQCIDDNSAAARDRKAYIRRNRLRKSDTATDGEGGEGEGLSATLIREKRGA